MHRSSILILPETPAICSPQPPPLHIIPGQATVCGARSGRHEPTGQSLSSRTDGPKPCSNVTNRWARAPTFSTSARPLPRAPLPPAPAMLVCVCCVVRQQAMRVSSQQSYVSRPCVSISMTCCSILSCVMRQQVMRQQVPTLFSLGQVCPSSLSAFQG